MRMELIKKVRFAKHPPSPGRPVVTEDGVYFGDERTVTKLNITSLEPEWTVPAKKYRVWIETHSAVIFFGDGGKYRAIRPDGTLAWERKVPFDRFHWRDKVVFCGQPFEVVDLGTGLAVEQFDGPQALDALGGFGDVWLLREYGREAPPGSTGDPVVAFDMVSRKVLWSRNILTEIRRDLGSVWQTSLLLVEPVDAEKFVHVHHNHICGASMRDGSRLWHVDLGSEFLTVTHHQGQIYVWLSAKDQSNHFLALDAATGRVVCRVDLGRNGGAFLERQRPLPGPSQILGEHVVYTTPERLIALVRMADGEVAWSYSEHSDFGRAVVRGNRLYVCGGDGFLYIFEAA